MTHYQVVHNDKGNPYADDTCLADTEVEWLAPEKAPNFVRQTVSKHRGAGAANRAWVAALAIVIIGCVAALLVAQG